MIMASVKHKHQHSTNFSKKEEFEAALNAFFRIAELWGLDRVQQSALLGGVSRQTLSRWESELKEGVVADLSFDQMDRISYLLGIHKALRIIYPFKEMAYSWVKRCGRIFDGKNPIEFMVEGKTIIHLQYIRQYLDDVRGGHSA